MNVLLNFLIIFIFILLILALKLPNIGTNNVIMNKVYLYLGIFLLQVVVLTMDNINNKCKMTTRDILREASRNALVTVIGYSLYIDVLFSPLLRERYSRFIEIPNKNMFFVAFIISGFFCVFKLMDNLILPLECSA